MNKSDTTTAFMICFYKALFLSDYMFRLSSLGHRQFVSLYGGNYTLYNMTFNENNRKTSHIVPYYTLYSFLDKNLRPDDDLVKRAETCSHLKSTHYKNKSYVLYLCLTCSCSFKIILGQCDIRLLFALHRCQLYIFEL